MREIGMKTFLAVAFAATLCLAAGCASRGGASADGGSAAGSSGITVYGTIDATVSNVRNQSR